MELRELKAHKVTLLGPISVGKTSIVQRLVNDEFDSNTSPTIGVSFAVKRYPDLFLKLQFWDTCGTEKYANVVKVYYKKVDACLVVFDLNVRDSLQKTEKWIRLFNETCDNPRAVVYLVGNKSDLEVRVPQKEIDDICKRYNMRYFRVSAKQNVGINGLFKNLAETLKKLEIVFHDAINLEELENPKNCDCVII